SSAGTSSRPRRGPPDDPPPVPPVPRRDLRGRAPRRDRPELPGVRARGLRELLGRPLRVLPRRVPRRREQRLPEGHPLLERLPAPFNPGPSPTVPSPPPSDPGLEKIDAAIARARVASEAWRAKRSAGERAERARAASRAERLALPPVIRDPASLEAAREALER